MKISCIQMDMEFASPDANYGKASSLIDKAVSENPDVIVLPELWNTGFFPRENLQKLCDKDGARTKCEIGGLAKKYGVNIVAGSVSNIKNGKIYNTAFIFDRSGKCIAEYDKTHLFTPMGEHEFYTNGDRICRFMFDGIWCGMIICYDIRFPELTRSMALKGMDIMFVSAQWPDKRINHLRCLSAARAIENQMFVVCCNSCGKAPGTVYGGNSSVTAPFGETLCLAGESEQIITADCDMSVISGIRSSINVFRDRRPDIYNI